jgi:hypothetical protein
MSDRFEEAVEGFMASVKVPGKPYYLTSAQVELLTAFIRWYEEHRGTCETCKHGGDCEVQCAGQGYVNALLGFGKFGCIYHVEKETK